MKRLGVLHPFLFALFPVFSLYVRNIDQTSISSFLWALAASLLLAAGVFHFFKIFYKSPTRAGLIASLAIVIFFTYGHVHTFLIEEVVGTLLAKHDMGLINDSKKYEVWLHILLMTVSLVFISVPAIILWTKSNKDFSQWTQYLNLVSLIILVLMIIKIEVYNITHIYIRHYNQVPSTTEEGMGFKQKHDIYYIILDGYAREDVLKEFYGFDNSDFINYLKGKGFMVASQSHSNYAWTSFSLASSLNLNYINDVRKIVGPSSNDVKILYSMIENNEVVRFLKSQGYIYVHFGSTWNGTMFNKRADREVRYTQCIFGDEFWRVLAETTMLKLIDSSIVQDLAQSRLYAFQKLATIPQIKQPTFTFVHIVLPHPPFIFDRFGNVKKHITLSNQFETHGWGDQKAYVEQTIFLNNKMKETIDALLNTSDIAPIIIIQSDHGPHVYGKGINNTNPRARMSNFMAYYLPEGGEKYLYDSITPVNSFRIIFNFYFHTQYELLKDKMYFSRFRQPYQFLDLTDNLLSF